MSVRETMDARDLPRGFNAFGGFLIFGAVMAGFAGTTLLWPGTALDRLWTLNALAHEQLAPLGWKIGIPFLFLAVDLAVTSWGWFFRRRWGWALSVGVIGIQVLGDLVNAVRGDILKGALGVLIAGALLFYLFCPSVKRVFAKP